MYRAHDVGVVIAATSSNGAIGHAALITGLFVCVFGAFATVTALRQGQTRLLRMARGYALASAVAAGLAMVVMWRALIVRDWNVAYVQQVGSENTPAFYNLAALWSALEGSILLWLFMLALYTAIIARRYRNRLDDPLIGWALVVMFVVTGFFFFLAFGPVNAFASAGSPDFTRCCTGPNPLLQNHVLVMFHPPILYLGYVGFTVPFAFAIAALVTGRVGEGWLIETRRWALFAWGLLTIGILLGGWWAYEVLGWGGVWGWDPVENASLLPWLTGSAYIHSVLVQERRGMLRVWNISLLLATFALTILGTFLTRSGVINSVHAFSNSEVGPVLLGFFGVITLVSLGLIAWRGDRLRSPGAIDTPLSREGAFLINNVAFALFAFVVLLGTVFPLIVEALQDRRIVVGAPFFDRLTMPIGLTLLFLMAVAPVLPWRATTTEVLRERLFWPAWVGAAALAAAVLIGADQLPSLLAFGLGGFAIGAAGRQLALATRRQGWRGFVGRANGGMVVHIGVILIGVALAASNSYTRVGEFTLQPGQVQSFAGHTFELVDVVTFEDARTVGIKAPVSIDGGQAYAPAITTFRGSGQAVPTPSVRTGVQYDVYLTLESGSRVAQDGAPAVANIKVSLKPMILWLWIGGGIIVLGTLLAAFPGQRRRRPIEPVSAPAMRDPAGPPPNTATDEAADEEVTARV